MMAAAGDQVGMRVVGGRHKGRKLDAPLGLDVRPTADRTREALFNRLAHAGWGHGGRSVLMDAAVLDSFCGTGALTMEALSRGAVSATLMDTNRLALDCARKNASVLSETENCRFLQVDATAPPKNETPPATLVFLDPPYAFGVGPLAMSALAAAGWIADGGICVLEMSAKDAAPRPPDNFDAIDSRRYGAAQIVFFRYRAER